MRARGIAAVATAFLGAALSVAPPPSAVAQQSRAAAIVDRLSTRQLAGQRVIYSYHGLTPPQLLFDLIEAGEVGGVIFFGENIESHSQIRAVVDQLQAAALRSPVGIPLAIMTDQEGGIVRRLPGAPRLSAKQVGQSANPVETARRMARGAAENLSSVGISINLAPVLDVYREEGNFIDQFGRSFSMSPSVVARLGETWIKEQQAHGVAATAKHFPGLGAAAAGQNTDAGPVVLDLPLSEIRSVDELPYHSALAGSVELIMVSWATYPALDPNLPAGLSPTVVQGELRRGLGFFGVTITDALEAGALAAFGPVPGRAVPAAQAGMDIFMFSSRNPFDGMDGVTALVQALKSRRLARGAFEDAVERVLDLRMRYDLT